MMKYLGLFLILLMEAGCQVTKPMQSYDDRLSYWIGWPETQLYAVWGQPSQVFYVSNDEKVVSYMKNVSEVENNNYQAMEGQGIGMTSWWEKWFAPVALYEEPSFYYCKTSFVIKNGIVVQYNFNGDACGSV